ncbi:hypothetical protein [Nitratireductor aquibiodomus]|uniref:hypothetical protein n=1 Tax=Nitratireductor aquibiodomus TaxID=204799 RepID=UPI0012DD0E2D|nr:hypothetical protein [Nitratireductor aquibiodomus]
MVSEGDERELARDYAALRAAYAEGAFLIRAWHLQALLEARANFNPGQPRVPRGYRFGGRWTGPGGDWGGPARDDGRARIVAVSGDPDEPKIPHRRPARARQRNRIGRAAARYLRTLPLWQQVRFLARVGWLANEAGHTTRSYSDEPRALEELKERATVPSPGYDIHHIVEKTPAYRDGFSREMIESPDNKVLVPRYKHWEITAWYASKNEEWGGVSPRAYLRGRNWEERELMGRYALRKFGVLK